MSILGVEKIDLITEENLIKDGWVKVSLAKWVKSVDVKIRNSKYTHQFLARLVQQISDEWSLQIPFTEHFVNVEDMLTLKISIINGLENQGYELVRY